jgi:hypothetical protein
VVSRTYRWREQEDFKFAIITGQAEEYPDRDQSLERRKFMRNMSHVSDELDLDAILSFNEQGGRVVFRIRVDPVHVASMDARKAADPGTGKMGTPEGAGMRAGSG